MTRDDTTGMLILMNEDALRLATGTMEVPPGARLIVAGQSLVQTTLAELQLPGAQMIWTDFRQSASLSALHSTVQAAGGLDQLVLAGDGTKSEAMFSLMCAVLTFLPALARKKSAAIALVVDAGPAVRSLDQFVRRIKGSLQAKGIALELRVRTPA